MSTLGTPDAQNVLGQLREEVIATIDDEIDGNLIDRWINRVIEQLSGVREFSFFFQRADATLGAADSTGIRILPLPADLKKLFLVLTKDSVITQDTSAATKAIFEQGKHFDLFWNLTRKAFDARFFPLSGANINDPVPATTTIAMEIEYYILPSRLLLDGSQTRIPVWFTDVIIQGVLMKCYKKLGDLQEYVLTEREFNKLVRQMNDDDAREPALPGQMAPNRNQTQEEYGNYLDAQKYAFETFYQRFS